MHRRRTTRAGVRGIPFAEHSRMARPRKTNLDAGAPAPSAPQNVGDTTAAAPDRDRIAMRAYELYLARGGESGSALDDWLTAERELNPPTGLGRES